MKKTFLFLLVAVVFGQTFMLPQPVQAGGVLEFFFPSLRKEPYDPTLSLQAPFADQEAQELKPLAVGQLPENAVALDMPHRVDSDIGEWVVMAISESLAFTELDYSNDLVRTKGYFSLEGREQYALFLRNKSILKVLESKKFFIRNFVADVPFTLNKGPVDGRFRWLFEVPVMLSYMKRDMDSYKEDDAINQKVILTIQVGRDSDASNESGILIERWSGKLQKIDKK